jgi:hypothetical protein
MLKHAYDMGAKLAMEEFLEKEGSPMRMAMTGLAGGAGLSMFGSPFESNKVIREQTKPSLLAGSLLGLGVGGGAGIGSMLAKNLKASKALGLLGGSGLGYLLSRQFVG